MILPIVSATTERHVQIVSWSDGLETWLDTGTIVTKIVTGIANIRMNCETICAVGFESTQHVVWGRRSCILCTKGFHIDLFVPINLLFLFIFLLFQVVVKKFK